MTIRSSIASAVLTVLICLSAHAQPHSQTVKPPTLVKFVQADYPASERALGRDVSVLLAISIAADGTAADVTVVESAGPAFDDVAVAAARQFVFEPAQVDGVAVPVRIQYRYAFSLGNVAAVAPKDNAEFAGLVRDRKTGRGIAGVRVDLDGASTITDAEGKFHFSDVSPGNHSVSLSSPDFTPTATEEKLESGQRLDTAYDLETRASGNGVQVDLELVIIDTPVQKSIAATVVSADQGARVAGTGGDVIKVVENLPGVARSSVGSSALVVWGAAGTDTRIYVDDVRIPLLYHEGGYRSVIHSDLVQSVELEPGGYGAAHGRGLGGLVNVGLKPLAADGFHGSLALDAIDAAASLRGNFGDKVRFAAAFRRSHLDSLLRLASTRDVGDFVPIPRYWDSQLRLAWVPREGESVELGALLSSDDISRSVTAADPAENKRDAKHRTFDRLYVRYENRQSDGSRVSVTPFLGLDNSRVLNAFGAVPAQLDNETTSFGVRAAYSGNATNFLNISTGIDAELQFSSVRRVGAVTLPPREGDVFVFGQAPRDQVNADTWKTAISSLAPYAQADLSLFDGALHLIPGLRVEPTLIQSNRRAPQVGEVPDLGVMREHTGFEPRLALRAQLGSVLGLRAAFGIYHQPPLAEDLSAVFGNPQLGQARAMHYLGGANIKFTDTLSLEVTGFFSRQTDLVTRSALPAPQRAESLVSRGIGRAYGGQLLLRQDLTNRFFGWLSYSLVRSQRIDGGAGDYRLFDYDQTHILTALASYVIGAGFEVGVRFRFASGYPRTPVVGSVYDSRTDSYQPVFGAKNSIRIPSFYELDVRVTKRFSFGARSELEIYLDVHNVTDRRNAEEIIYTHDFTQKSYISGLPILPVLGAKFVW